MLFLPPSLGTLDVLVAWTPLEGLDFYVTWIPVAKIAKRSQVVEGEGWCSLGFQGTRNESLQRYSQLKFAENLSLISQRKEHDRPTTGGLYTLASYLLGSSIPLNEMIFSRLVLSKTTYIQFSTVFHSHRALLFMS